MSQPSESGAANQLPRLRRIRWAVRDVLIVGVAASVAANVLHAPPNPVSRIIAAWSPLALLLTVEVISRVPVNRRWLAVVRRAVAGGIACIAAWVSYWHMASVAASYGESGASVYVLPLSVDGLVVVTSISLVELAGRITAAESASTTHAPAVSAKPNAPKPAPASPPAQPVNQPPQAAMSATIRPAPRHAGSSDTPRSASDEDLIRDARTAVTRALRSGELRRDNGEIKQRESVALVKDATGIKVGQPRAVRIVEAIRDTTPPTPPRIDTPPVTPINGREVHA